MYRAGIAAILLSFGSGSRVLLTVDPSSAVLSFAKRVSHGLLCALSAFCVDMFTMYKLTCVLRAVLPGGDPLCENAVHEQAIQNQWWQNGSVDLTRLIFAAEVSLVF